MNSIRIYGCLISIILLPSTIEGFEMMIAPAFMDPAAAIMTPSGAKASLEAKSVVDCRETFIPTPDDFLRAFEKCSMNKDLDGKPFCLHRCAYTSLDIIGQNGEINQDNLEDVAEKIYRGKSEAAEKSRKSFAQDFKECYESEMQDWSQTKSHKCIGMRKFVKCLKEKNSAVCTQRNVKQESKQQAAAKKEDDYE